LRRDELAANRRFARRPSSQTRRIFEVLAELGGVDQQLLGMQPTFTQVPPR